MFERIGLNVDGNALPSAAKTWIWVEDRRVLYLRPLACFAGPAPFDWQVIPRNRG
jgi:hypothetical protein